MECTFFPSRGSKWLGRYDRIPGDQSVFHLRYSPRLHRFWPVAVQTVDGDTLHYWFAEHPAIALLADTVGELQLRYGGQEGGSFTINEWGQVLVPCGAGDRRRYFAGTLTGDWYLTDPDDPSQILSLNDDDGLDCGDSWDLPYVGMPFRLSRGNRIYCVHREPKRERLLWLPYHDADLIAALRSVRRWGSLRFIVNPFGIVLTKRPTRSWTQDDEAWEPVYIGRINYERWFSRPEP